MPLETVPVPVVCEGGGAAPGVGLSAGRAGIGIVGTAALGRGVPGVVIITGGAGAEGAGWAAGGAALIGALSPGALIPGTLAPGARTPGALGALAAGEVLIVSSGGRGWRGPERICPGRGGGGAERDGITGPRLAGAFGPPGCPVANGGRNGNAGRTGAGASELSGSAETVGRAGSGGA